MTYKLTNPSYGKNNNGNQSPFTIGFYEGSNFEISPNHEQIKTYIAKKYDYRQSQIVNQSKNSKDKSPIEPNSFGINKRERGIAITNPSKLNIIEGTQIQ